MLLGIYYRVSQLNIATQEFDNPLPADRCVVEYRVYPRPAVLYRYVWEDWRALGAK